jgi:hypothetical protein
VQFPCATSCPLTWPVTGISTDSRLQHSCCALLLLLLRPTAACHQSTNSRTACSNSPAVSCPVRAAEAIRTATAGALVRLLAGYQGFCSGGCGLVLLLLLQGYCAIAAADDWLIVGASKRLQALSKCYQTLQSDVSTITSRLPCNKRPHRRWLLMCCCSTVSNPSAEHVPLSALGYWH